MKVLPKKKKTNFHCSPQWKMDNSVEVINVAYDKWILRASEGSLGPRLCAKPMRRLGGGRGSPSALPRLSRAVNQSSGLHHRCQHSDHDTSPRRAAERRCTPPPPERSTITASPERERNPLLECLHECFCMSNI